MTHSSHLPMLIPDILVSLFSSNQFLSQFISPCLFLASLHLSSPLTNSSPSSSPHAYSWPPCISLPLQPIPLPVHLPMLIPGLLASLFPYNQFLSQFFSTCLFLASLYLSSPLTNSSPSSSPHAYSWPPCISLPLQPIPLPVHLPMLIPGLLASLLPVHLPMLIPGLLVSLFPSNQFLAQFISPCLFLASLHLSSPPTNSSPSSSPHAYSWPPCISLPLQPIPLPVHLPMLIPDLLASLFPSNQFLSQFISPCLFLASLHLSSPPTNSSPSSSPHAYS